MKNIPKVGSIFENMFTKDEWRVVRIDIGQGHGKPEYVLEFVRSTIDSTSPKIAILFANDKDLSDYFKER